MRLTLRTLLAYLDGNLEPADADDIGKKIEESEFASKLVHTIRECIQRPRLGAPPLVGRGLGADPNTVAEYLEYRLADERVPEFERICLESEVSLAEVASCHQILTLVLGEPAEIDSQTRERLYALAAQADAPPPQSDSLRQPVAAPIAGPPGSAAVPPVVRRPKPEVPDYLRESRWPIWPVAALVLVAATLTFAGLFFFGPAPLRQQITAMMGGAEQAEPGEQAERAEDAAAEPSDAPADTADAQQPTDARRPADADESASGRSPEAVAESGPPTDVADAAATDEPAETARPLDDLAADDEAMPLDAPSDAAPEAPLARPAPGAPLDATAPLPPEPGDRDMPADKDNLVERSNPPGALPADDAAPLAGAIPAANGAAPVEPAPGDRPAPAEGFGRFLSQTRREVLLRFDPAKGEWFRLPVLSPLNKGDQLKSLPLYHPTITLSTNIAIEADGAADFELVGWDADDTPILGLRYGRLLMSTVGRASNSVQLRFDELDALVTFVDPESTVALEVRRVLPPGKNPEAGVAPLSAMIYATSGVVRVVRGDGAPLELQAPAVLSLVDDEQPRQAEMPAWVVSSQRSDLDFRAAGDVEANLATDAPAGLQLRELNDPKHRLFRKREVQTLAIRGLANLGEYAPALAALNNEDLKNSWPDIAGELRAAIARSPESAMRVRAALEKSRGELDGRGLYRMLWGYSVNDLQTGSDRDLIDALGRNDALDFRVLAIQNLQELSGGATFGYHPEDTEFKRRGPTNTWKQRITKLTPRSPTPAPRGRAAAPGA